MTQRTTVTYNQFDIVVVPFPFVDSQATKKRPAIILSSNQHFNADTGHSIMAMITSARNSSWPHDINITDLTNAGLPKPSVIRMKLFTLDHRLILEHIGTLSAKDKKTLSKTLKLIFNGLL